MLRSSACGAAFTAWLLLCVSARRDSIHIKTTSGGHNSTHSISNARHGSKSLETGGGAGWEISTHREHDESHASDSEHTKDADDRFNSDGAHTWSESTSDTHSESTATRTKIEETHSNTGVGDDDASAGEATAEVGGKLSVATRRHGLVDRRGTDEQRRRRCRRCREEDASRSPLNIARQSPLNVTHKSTVNAAQRPPWNNDAPSPHDAPFVVVEASRQQ